MDTSWIDLRNDDPTFFKGCMNFFELAKETLIEGKTRYPCSKCKLRKWYSADDVGGHILFNSFHKEYRNWIFHRKNDETSNTQGPLSSQETIVGRDDSKGLLTDAFSVSTPSTYQPQDQSFEEPHFEEEVLGDMHEEDDFPSEVDTELPSFNTKEEEIKYKRLIEASDEVLYEGCTTFSKLSFLLHLFHLKCMFHWSAESFKKLLELLIDAFPQIMESYYGGKKVIKDLGLGYEKINACPNNCMLYWGDSPEKDKCQICHTSRLKRIYMSSKTIKDMRWHKDDRDNDGMLRHPTDALALKKVGEKYHEFAGDPRSVRLGLASDVFNPYRLINTNHRKWPVVLIPYNLPPWLCVDAFDAYNGKTFKLRAALHSSISDFPAYAIFLGKICYLGFRKWLHVDHPYRNEAALFDGKPEYGIALVRESGLEVLKEQEGIIHFYRKTNISSKKSGKKKEGEDKLNVCDNLLRTLLDMDKRRDDENARKALKELGIRPHIWLQPHANRVSYMPPASYTMSLTEKDRFLRVLKKLKVPDGYGSNVHNIDDSSIQGKVKRALARGPSNRVKRGKGFLISGCKFDVMDRERRRKTQYSGIVVEAEGQEYFEKLKEIYELNYYGSYKVVMFRCDWVDIHKGLKTNLNGSVCVNFSKLMHTSRYLYDDPFVFSTYAKQVFYVENKMQKGWFYVIRTKPRDLFEVGGDGLN
ncbi:uncharacterized protein LOC104899023 [Beta vulgaris subsp. vulgaris]|uniref:uncharacterized protein LOC104899023 n=1 Tax=Beta vulgaris subsp. vulgaris TaxID=3555 RepID=UPI00053F8ADA|nr:uncharacterized protein LOC104899023 [Beta vulgaris subsp. vulgaris]